MELVTSLLIVSFSPIAIDARVLKQVRHFSRGYEVTTCGYGEAPAGVVEHIRIPDGASSSDLYGKFITMHLYSRAYWRIGAVAWCCRNLPRGNWDIVLANDVETVPLALSLRPRLGLHADLHEFTPRLHEDSPAWDRRIRPFYEWLCRRYVTRATSWTTVGDELVREYEKEFGFRPELVTNAAPYAQIMPTEASRPIRMVHSGACLRNRNLMACIDAVALAKADVTLDFYLTKNDPGYLAELAARAAEVPAVRINEPVPYDELLTTLNGFDVGVHVLPPVNFNNEWALPNKLFDYVQARLAVLVGPSAEMAKYVSRYSLGVVADDFSSEALAMVINELTEESVNAFKQNADAAAKPMSAEVQIEVWDRAIRRIAQGE
jgi:hypothetical protein